MTKWLSLMAAGLLAATVTACSSDTGGGEAANGNGGGMPAAADGKSVVTLSVRQSNDYYEALEKKFEEKYPDIDLQIKAYKQKGEKLEGGDYANYQKTANTELLAGKGADIYEASSLPLKDYLAKNTFLNMDDLLAKDTALDKSDLEMNILNAVKMNGGTYVIPVGFGLRAFIGDGDALKNATYDDQTWTWADFAAQSQKIIEQEQADGKERRYAITDYPPDMLLQEMLIDDYSAFVDSAARKAKFDSPEFLAMIGEIRQMYDDNVMTGDPKASGRMLFYSAPLNKPEDFINVPYGLFANPKLVQKPHAEDAPGGMRIIPLTQFAIRAKTPAREDAWKFVSFALSADAQKLEGREGMSLLKSVNDARFAAIREQTGNGSYKLPDGKAVKVPDDQLAGFRQTIDSASNFALLDTQLINIVIEEALTYFGGQKSAEEAAKLMQSRTTTYLNE